jgi:hypothetical protein
MGNEANLIWEICSCFDNSIVDYTNCRVGVVFKVVANWIPSKPAKKRVHH